MNCANPVCGHPLSEHEGRDGPNGDACMVQHYLPSGPTFSRFRWCPCMAFVAPCPREPLLAQLDAVLRTRKQLP